MNHHSEDVIIGVDPHKLSATIEVVDQYEQLLGTGLARVVPGFDPLEDR